MANIRTLTVKVVARTKAFQQGMKEAEQSLDSLTQSMDRTALGAQRLSTVLGIAALGGLVLLTKSSLESLDTLGKLSDQLDLNTTSLKTLQLAAASSGTSNDALARGLQILSRRLGEARKGSRTVIRSFKELGLSGADLANQGIDFAIRRIAESIKQLQDPTRRAAAAMAIFGKQGVQMLNFLQQGAAGIDAAAEKVEAFGLAVTRHGIDKVQDLRKAFGDLKIQVAGLGDTMAVAVADPLTDIVTSLTDAIGNFKKMDTVMAKMVVTGAGLIVGLKVVWELFKGIIGIILKIGLAITVLGLFASAFPIAALVGALTVATGSFAVMVGAITGKTAQERTRVEEESAENVRRFTASRLNIANRGLRTAPQLTATETKALERAGDRIRDSVKNFGLTAIQILQRQRQEVTDLFEKGAIDRKTLSKAIAQLNQAFAEKMGAALKAAGDRIRDSVKNFGLSAFEILKKQEAAIRRVFHAGGIGFTTASRAIQQKRQQFFDAIPGPTTTLADIRRQRDLFARRDSLRARRRELLGAERLTFKPGQILTSGFGTVGVIGNIKRIGEQLRSNHEDIIRVLVEILQTQRGDLTA